MREIAQPCRVNPDVRWIAPPAAKRRHVIAPGVSPGSRSINNPRPRGAMIPDFGRRDLCRPLRGCGILREPDPRVTLAALAHPGLNSVAGYAGWLTHTSHVGELLC